MDLTRVKHFPTVDVRDASVNKNGKKLTQSTPGSLILEMIASVQLPLWPMVLPFHVHFALLMTVVFVKSF